MKTFVVGHIDWFDHELILEKYEVSSWRIAVALHTKYPFHGDPNLDPPKESTTPELFRGQCFDVDCMMNWIEVSNG